MKKEWFDKENWLDEVMLGEEEGQVLYSYYAYGKDPTEIAQALGITKKEVVEIAKNSLRKLQQYSKKHAALYIKVANGSITTIDPKLIKDR